MQKADLPTEGVYSYVEEESGLIKKRSRKGGPIKQYNNVFGKRHE